MRHPFAAAFLALAGCAAPEDTAHPYGEPGDPNENDNHGTLEALSLDPTAVELPTTRDSALVVATGSWSDGATTDVTAMCAWSFVDYGVAAVDGGGVVYGLGVGATLATCQVEEQTADMDVSVLAVAGPAPGDIVINEVLAGVPEGDDVNGDGSDGGKQEQFVELVNASPFTVELTGATLWDSDIATPRHTFGAGVLLPGDATVIFGGGQPSLGVQRCVALGAYNDDGDSSTGLALDVGGDTVRLLGADGGELAVATYDDSFPEESLVLDPELDGTDYIEHTTVPGSVGAYSPCTLATGEAFPTAEERLGE